MKRKKTFLIAFLAIPFLALGTLVAEECLFYSVKPDGSGLRLEVEADLVPGFSAYGSPNLSSDGKRLIFDASPSVSGFSQAKILVKILDGEDKGQIEDFDFGNCPVWSPDGTRVAFSVNSRNQKGFRPGAVIIDESGENEEWVGPYRLPRWTPDGKSLVVVTRTAALLKLGMLDLETKEVEPYLDGYSFVEQIRWFPDGKRILAHVASPDGTVPNQLLTMNLQGDEASIVKLDEGVLEFASISYDGKMVSYVIQNDRGGNDIYVVAADGKTKPKKLEVLPNVAKEDFCWLKEDNRILFNAPGRIPIDQK